jgi:hypothetical protein
VSENTAMINTQNVPEPTSDQCSTTALVYTDGPVKGWATWYPQMGGYVGRAVVLVSPDSSCVDVLVWHDGEFPFGQAAPVHLHHCDPEQFVSFGQRVMALQDACE